MRKVNKLTLAIAAAILALISFILCISGGAVSRAATSAYTNSNVLKDLQKDNAFNASDYPDNANDYSVKVIQVAETTDKRLLIYTYQPCQKTRYLVATDVNMSLSETAQATKLYALILVNTNGVFAKYQVKDVAVTDKPKRVYNVTSIYRAWDKEIDKDTGNNNTIDKKAFNVSKVFTVTTDGSGALIYSMNPTQVVEIINPYSDYLIYTKSSPALPNLPSLAVSSQKYEFFDCHYIAFSTDWDIDRLLSAEVHYMKRSGEGGFDHFLLWDFNGDLFYGDPEEAYASPTYLDRVALEGSGHLGKKYKSEWDRIQTVAEFLATEQGLTDETKKNLDGKQWVLRFTETERTQKETNIVGYKKYKSKFTKVDNVSVLRLEFETDGVIYNLGAVSDTVSGDDHAGNAEQVEHKSIWQRIVDVWNKVKRFFKGIQWWQWLLIVVGAILLIGFIVAIISFGIQAVFKFILWLIKKLFQGLWWLVSLPFRLIAKAIKNRKGGVK